MPFVVSDEADRFHVTPHMESDEDSEDLHVLDLIARERAFKLLGSQASGLSSTTSEDATPPSMEYKGLHSFFQVTN